MPEKGRGIGKRLSSGLCRDTMHELLFNSSRHSRIIDWRTVYFWVTVFDCRSCVLSLVLIMVVTTLFYSLGCFETAVFLVFAIIAGSCSPGWHVFEFFVKLTWFTFVDNTSVNFEFIRYGYLVAITLWLCDTLVHCLKIWQRLLWQYGLCSAEFIWLAYVYCCYFVCCLDIQWCRGCIELISASLGGYSARCFYLGSGLFAVYVVLLFNSLPFLAISNRCCTR